MKIALMFLLIVNYSLMNGQEKALTSITVEINNASNDEGKIIFGLYTQETFMKAPPVKSAESSIKDGKVVVVFEDVTPGSYSILCYHDANGNQQMDFEPNGMPKEKYGSSNNRMAMGPPSWEETKFEVGSDPIKIEIRL